VTAGLAGVQARIADIQGRFTPPPALRIPTARAAATSATLPGTAAGVGTTPEAQAFSRAFALATAEVGAPGRTGGAVTGEQVVESAKKYLGVPYLWGGTDPAKGLDCSGFIQRAYADLGIELPRVSRDQAKAGTAVPSLEQARAGDLVAFNDPVDHIGIYLGDGKMIVAPRRGDVVKIQDVYETPSAIRRVLPDAGAAGAPVGPAAAPASVARPAALTGSAQFSALFAQAGARHGVPPALLEAVAKVESNFDPTARSSAGAQGLMQLMPATARGLGVDAWNPAQAVDGAARLLRSHLDTFGSTELALAAYNAGPGAVKKHGGIPPYRETQAYVPKVLSYYRGAAA
jgi:cell wall-associated NlpC family hydrolase